MFSGTIHRQCTNGCYSYGGGGGVDRYSWCLCSREALNDTKRLVF